MVTANVTNTTPIRRRARQPSQAFRQGAHRHTVKLHDAKMRLQHITPDPTPLKSSLATRSRVVVVAGSVAGQNQIRVADFIAQLARANARYLEINRPSNNVTFTVHEADLPRYAPEGSITAKIIRRHIASVKLAGRSGRRSQGNERRMLERARNIGIPATAVGSGSANLATAHDDAGTFTQLLTHSLHDHALQRLRSAGLELTANRLHYLREISETDPEEPAIHAESLETFAKFVLANPRLDTGSIGVNDEGYVSAQWFLSPEPAPDDNPDERRFWGNGRGMIGMQFLLNGMVRFAANSGPAIAGAERLRKSATCPLEKVPEELASYLPKVITS